MNERERIAYERLIQIQTLIDNKEDSELIEYIEDFHTADIADLLLELDNEYQLKFFSILSWDQASKVMEEVDSDTFVYLLELLRKEFKTIVLEQMAQDDMVDLLSELDEEKKKEIISLLDKENAMDIRELLVYKDDTAGGIMTKGFVTVKEDITVYQAIEELRNESIDAETIYYVYVEDKYDRLVGVLSLRELIVAQPNKIISDCMHENVITVYITTDQEDVARKVSKYDLLAIPVIDNTNKIRGIITVDDIIDVIQAEATEDIYKFAGTSETEDIYEEKVGTRIFTSFKSRLPWLIITLFGGLLSAQVIKGFEEVLSTNAAVAMFMPLLAGMGGNVGTQSSTLTVRGIAVGTIEGKEVPKTIFQEMLVGCMVGFVCSILIGIVSFILQGDLVFSCIVGIAMLANMITAATIGTLVPIIFKSIGVDPAVASAPFITTTIDITGLSIYFTLTTLLITKFT